MNKPESPTAGLAVPRGRLSRFWHLGRASADLIAGVGVRGMVELARSKGSESSRIHLSPEATRRFTDRLARMRGAVMKMGQLMSLDGADVLTPEAAGILAALRDRAEPMPLSQLMVVLDAEYGPGWQRQFRRFAFTPIAAASIGQVHRVETRDGRHLALKIQFPGVRESIDSDIDNLAFLGRTLGLAPRGMDLGPLFAEARRQLHREADYHAEADSLEQYAALIGADGDFRVPAVHRDLSTARVLAMDFAEGVPVDRLADGDYRRAERDRVASLLTRLALRELFEFGLAQTDPNFGNFLYDANSGRIVLLDFGAAQGIPPALAAQYRALAAAAVADDPAGLRAGALALGYIGPDDPLHKVTALVELIRLSSEVLRAEGGYDFGTSRLIERVFNRGRDLYFEDAFTQLPNPSVMFLHRKFVGILMLCRRLRARVDLAGMLRPYLPG